MKKSKKALSTALILCLLIPAVLSAASALEAPRRTEIRAELWDGHFYVEGRRAFLTGADGASDLPLCYDGVIYAPAGTLARWAGKDLCVEDHALSLSGEKERAISSWPEQGTYDLEREARLRREGIGAVERGDLAVLWDGQTLPLAAQDGRDLCPLEAEGLLYLPVRCLCEAAGMQVTWASVNGEPSIYIRGPLEPASQERIREYLKAGYLLCDGMDRLEVDLRNAETAEQIEAILRRQESLLLQVEALLRENADLPFLAYGNSTIAKICQYGQEKIAACYAGGVSSDSYLDVRWIIQISRIHIRGELLQVQDAFDQKGVIEEWD